MNRLREGIVEENDKELLLSRVTQEAHLDTEAMHIFYTNDEVSGHNNRMLEQLEGEMVTLKAKKEGGPKGYVAPITNDGRIGSTQFFDKLNIKIGARVALTFNVSTMDGLVNGACGVIVGIESTSKLAKEKRVHAIIVKFDDEKCGREHRQKNPRFSKKYEKENGTPIFRTDLEYNIPSKKGFSGSAVAKVEQFPLRISYASTAHRMQVSQYSLELSTFIVTYHDLKYYALGTNGQSWEQSYPALAQANVP